MIFNKDNTGAIEIQRLVGTYAQTNDFGAIEAEIRYASMAVRRLIGESLFDRADIYYNSGVYITQGIDVDTTLVHAIQSAVAQLAMYQFYQQNIVSHEDGGRKVKIGENEKMPWAWQYERDDQAMLDKYYRALDELYIFVESEKIKEWKDAPVYKVLAGCFVRDLASFQKVYPLEDSFRMFYILVPFMIEAQEDVILPIIGKKTYDLILSGQVSDALKTQLTAVQRCIPLYAIITAVRRMSIKVLPTMIVKRFSASFQGGRGANIDLEAERHLLATLEREAADAKQKLQQIVTMQKPTTEADLKPNNSPRNKFCMT